ncbi:ABC transporter ATP-binding protein [Maledivibacter halophilus]|uniref:Iron(III) transport system ATP-binding protein n=1 Tax=Maledivibacter halophilus TaxID=36842 RepID=A0A1T5J8J1_9FIRM|nr:ABC transporter ATP-binding protein [Maledivibacter halophilus]SKC47689.1 iron(III) transport system ATP-binding protein [Maledivibacter halophilus]
MEITLNNITKKYGDVIAVDNISLEFKQGELIALLGPSGCGKTTLLRIIAGLISHDKGEIYFNGKDISKFSPQKRNAAMVFQNYALFPHLTVEQNVGYGLKVKKLPQKQINDWVKSVLERVELNNYGKRRIYELSGGQKQRVALARALVVQPDILLFDEPLSNLDEKLRVNMRQEIKKIQREIGITSVYVTHDQGEALAIADRIVVMDKGKIQQIAMPDELYYNPANAFVANFVGKANLIDCSLEKRKGNRAAINLLGKNIEVQIEKEFSGDIITVLLRPEEIRFVKNCEGIKAIVKWKENLGGINRYKLEAFGSEIVVDVFNRRNYNSLELGETVYIDFNDDAVYILYD